MFPWKNSKNFIRIPVRSARYLYASPMPFGPYDPFNQLMGTYRRHHINRAIPLVTDEELAKKAKRDLLREYARRRIAVTRCPIQDFTAPECAEISRLVGQMIEGLRTENTVVHCNAGVGRTGVVLACLLKRLHGMAATEAIEYIEGLMRVNLTVEQRSFIQRWPVDGSGTLLPAA